MKNSVLMFPQGSVCLGTCSKTSSHSSLKVGKHFLEGTLEHCSSSIILVTEAGTSLQTCFVVGWQTFLSKVEHFFSETSLVWTLGIKEQNRLGLFWQFLIGTSWQDLLSTS